MARIIEYDEAPEPMQRAWDRLLDADAELEKLKRTKDNPDRQLILDEHDQAQNHWRAVCRRHGHHRPDQRRTYVVHLRKDNDEPTTTLP